MWTKLSLFFPLIIIYAKLLKFTHGMDKVLIIPQWNFGASSVIEIIDLSGANNDYSKCSIELFHEKDLDMYGGLVDGRSPTVCMESTEDEDRCFMLDNDLKWNYIGELFGQRNLHKRAAVDVPNIGWWITGGKVKSSYDLKLSAQSAIFDPKTKQWSNGPELSKGRYSHCLVHLEDSEETIILGGRDPEVSKETWSYNWLEETWTREADMIRAREDFSCEYDPESGKIVVAGGTGKDGTGSRYVDLFDPLTRTWSDGPHLPVSLRETSMTRNATSVILSGGYTYFIETNHIIYKFSPEWWIDVAKKKDKISRVISMFIPDSLLSKCTS